MSFTRGPSKEHKTDKPPPTRRIQERSKGDTTCPKDLTESSVAYIMAEQCVQHQEGPRVRTSDLRQPRNESHHRETQDCESCSRTALLGSFTFLLSTRVPLPSELSLVCQHTCLLEQFLSVRQEPPLGPWKGPVFLQQQSYHAMQPQAQRADTQACCALIHRRHRAHDKTRLNRLAPRQQRLGERSLLSCLDLSLFHKYLVFGKDASSCILRDKQQSTNPNRL